MSTMSDVFDMSDAPDLVVAGEVGGDCVSIDVVYTPIIHTTEKMLMPLISTNTVTYDFQWVRLAPLHRQLVHGSERESELAFEKAGLKMQDYRIFKERWYVEFSHGKLKSIEVTPENWVAIRSKMAASARRKGKYVLEDRVNFTVEIEFRPRFRRSEAVRFLKDMEMETGQ